MSDCSESKELRTLAIGSVTVRKIDAPMGMVLVKVVASNITAPFGNGATCTPMAAMVFLKRVVNANEIDEASMQMFGNITDGYSSTFPPRQPGKFKAYVTLSWQINYTDKADGESAP